MKVLLIENVKGSGKKGDVIEVNDGFANNFLIKRKLAKQADKVVLNEKASQTASVERTKMLEREDALERAKQLRSHEFILHANLGKTGKMFGAITTKEIADEINSQGIKIDKRQIVLEKNIKTTGTYIVEAKLYSGVNAKFSIIVQ